MGRGVSETRYVMRAWGRGRSPGPGLHGAKPEDFARERSAAIESAATRQRAARARVGAGQPMPTPLRVAVVAFVWIVAVACVTYPWVLWSLM